jgi:hypothetical protein
MWIVYLFLGIIGIVVYEYLTKESPEEQRDRKYRNDRFWKIYRNVD